MPALAAAAVSFEAAAVVGTAAFVAMHTRKPIRIWGAPVRGATRAEGVPCFLPSFSDVDRGLNVGSLGPLKPCETTSYNP